MSRRVPLVIFILLVCFPSEVFCLDNKVTTKDRFYAFLQAGSFKGNDDTGNIKTDGPGYGYGLGLGYFLSRNLSIEGDFMYFADDYVRDSITLAPGTSSNKIEIASVSLAVNTKYFIRHKKLSFSFGAGIGFYDSDIYVREIGVDGKSNVNGDQAIGYQGIMGIGYSYTDRSRVELGWRGIFLDQNFGVYSNGKADTGGNYFYIGYRGSF